jgi:hypothetical protein
VYLLTIYLEDFTNKYYDAVGSLFNKFLCTSSFRYYHLKSKIFVLFQVRKSSQSQFDPSRDLSVVPHPHHAQQQRHAHQQRPTQQLQQQQHHSFSNNTAGRPDKRERKNGTAPYVETPSRQANGTGSRQDQSTPQRRASQPHRPTPGDGAGTAERRRTASAVEGGVVDTDTFARNQFDRSSQLRRSKKKRKKSSAADQTMSPGSAYSPTTAISPMSAKSGGGGGNLSVLSSDSGVVAASASSPVKSEAALSSSSLSPQRSKTAAAIAAEAAATAASDRASGPSVKTAGRLAPAAAVGGGAGSSKADFDPKYGNLI